MTEGFDYRALVDELSCRETDWLWAHRDELVREQRRLHVRELAVLAVLDRRGAVDPTTIATDDGVSARSVRDTVETARRLEDLPQVAAAVHAGAISDEQLAPLARLADAGTDTEWAARAPHTSPTDLAREVRKLVKPTPEEARARHDARSLRMWWDDQDRKRMLHVRGELPDVMGVQFETLIDDMVQEMRPAKGQAWARYDQRAADALLVLCDEHDQPKTDDTPQLVARKPRFHVEVPPTGPATIAGIPLPDSVVEQLRAQAIIEPVLIDEDGTPLVHGRAFAALSPKITRAALLRDGHCRCGTCDRRHGLQIHHLWPRSWGGTDDISNLAAVCVGGSTDHHPALVPHGPWLLLGNPNRPDGLRLVHRDQIPDLDHYIRRREPPTLHELDEDEKKGDHDARAGPDAA